MYVPVLPARKFAMPDGERSYRCAQNCVGEARRRHRFGDDSQMRACADMCRRCAESCRQMALARA
jgi:hypothetical protein